MKPISTLDGFAAHLRARMLRREHWDIIDEEFNRLALELFSLQVEQTTPDARAYYEARASTVNLKNWREIPALPSAVFKELQLSCIPPTERTTTFRSSGTTEQRPSCHFHHEKSLAIYESSAITWFELHLLDCGAAGSSEEPSNLRVIVLTPARSEAPHSSLVHMFDAVGRAVDFRACTFTGKAANNGTWLVDYDATLQSLKDAVEANEPVMLLGTAFSFVHLLDQMSEANLVLRLPAASRVLETGGYKGRSRVLSKAELYSLVQARLGIQPDLIVAEYGMSELSSQAYDHAANSQKRNRATQSSVSRCFHFPPWARLQVISPETGQEVAEGETGLIRVVDLANVYSVMALQTEDVGIRRGTGFELVGRAALAEARGCSLMTV
jgi:hypothetical protein